MVLTLKWDLLVLQYLNQNKQELKDLEKYVKRYSYSVFFISKRELAVFL